MNGDSIHCMHAVRMRRCELTKDDRYAASDGFTHSEHNSSGW